MCPKCHRIFTREVEQKEVIDEQLISAPPDPPFVMGGGNLQDPNLAPGPSVPTEEITIKYHFKCKHCGYEWTDVKTEDDPVKGNVSDVSDV